MWIYHQVTGKVERNGSVEMEGFSGYGVSHLNNATSETLPWLGPIPRGLYRVETRHFHDTPPTSKLKNTVLKLTPVGHNAHGRDPLLIHGGSGATASRGCIILPLADRERIRDSNDHLLLVDF
jgi:hypothetical protein